MSENITTTVYEKGKYVLQEDIKGNLSITGEDVEFDGNGMTCYGWLHITGKRHKIRNLVVQPPTMYSEKCSVCESPEENAFITIHKAENVHLDNVGLISPVKLEYFASISAFSGTSAGKDFAKAGPNAKFVNCKFYGETFNDPPESKYVLRDV